MIRFFDTTNDCERCLETYVNYVRKPGTVTPTFVIWHDNRSAEPVNGFDRSSFSGLVIPIGSRRWPVKFAADGGHDCVDEVVNEKGDVGSGVGPMTLRRWFY